MENTNVKIEAENIGTPFDDVFRTLLEKCNKLIIPVINEIFKTDYQMDEEVTLLSNVHYVPNEDGKSVKRVTDSCILVRNKLYHIECESNLKSRIEIRMIEYDFHIALSHKERLDGKYILKFPESAVLYLRHNSNTPDELMTSIILPDGSEITYSIPTVKVQHYSKEEIFDKHLLMFLPYYIMRFENELKNIDDNDKKLKELTDDYRYIYKRLRRLESEDIIDDDYLHNLVTLITRLIEVVARNTKNVKGEIISMGGQVLILESEIIRAEAIAQGIAETIIEFLTDYGDIPNDLKDTIYAQKDTSVLKKWSKLSARVSSIEEFKQKMFD